MDIHSNTAQAFAQFFNTEKATSPVIELLYQHMQDGHVCLDLEHRPEYISTAKNSQIISKSTEDTHPFILKYNKLYTNRNFLQQASLIENIQQLTQDQLYSTQRFSILNTLNNIIPDNFFSKSNEIDWQSIACVNTFLNRFSIITGGPGTGKTTTVAKVLYLELLNNPHLDIRLAAPTGKAAARLKESLDNINYNFDNQNINYEKDITNSIKNITTSTLHQLLGYQSGSNQFIHNINNPLSVDILIIDECSMIDLSLFSKTLQAIDLEKTKLILLGDHNQLAAVDAGSIFGDFCKLVPNINTFSQARKDMLQTTLGYVDIQISNQNSTLQDYIVSLQKSHRFDDSRGIGRLSKSILNFDIQSIKDIYIKSDNQIDYIQSLEEAIDYYIQYLFQDHYNSYIYEENVQNALLKINKIKILCSTKLGKNGVQQINQIIENKLKAHQKIYHKNRIFENQLIMVNKNQASLGIYNGDIGILRSETNTNGEKITYAYFLGSHQSIIQLLPGQIISWEPAHAMTIHKSQGSEFDEVIIIMPDVNQLSTRELFYTAVTRAKNKVLIFSNLDTIIKVTEQQVHRISGISDYLS